MYDFSSREQTFWLGLRVSKLALWLLDIIKLGESTNLHIVILFCVACTLPDIGSRGSAFSPETEKLREQRRHCQALDWPWASLTERSVRKLSNMKPDPLGRLANF